MTTLKHIEIGGGYTEKEKIIIDCAEIFGEFETMALDDDSEELDCYTSDSKDRALKAFDDMVNKYAGELQKAIYNANLKTGGKYTLVYWDKMGVFQVCQKITLENVEFTTYAQYDDTVKLTYRPYKARASVEEYFYNSSLMIFEGWQDLKQSDLYNTISDNGTVKLLKSKYSSFEAGYIEDSDKILKNLVVSYKNYKKGVNGKIYA